MIFRLRLPHATLAGKDTSLSVREDGRAESSDEVPGQHGGVDEGKITGRGELRLRSQFGLITAADEG